MGIEQIVVLVLENRSFDHMLGWAGIPDMDGLTGTESNADSQAQQYTVTKNAATSIDPDPSHGYHEVSLQLFGSTAPPKPPVATNSGFVRSFEQLTGQKGGPGRIMDCFDPAVLPVLNQLAHEFVLCDRWFCAVPGPTWPNRFFFLCATSDGRTDNKVLHKYNMKTICEALEENGRDWRIYHDGIPLSVALSRLRAGKRRRKFTKMDRFYDDARNDSLPDFSFIEPRYFKAFGDPANDQHSDHDVRHGENLIADVYEALRRNPAVWNKTLLIVTYDEHGGIYDHVPPPYDGCGMSIPNPDGKVDKVTGFAFDRLGPRVPAVLISPWVPKGVVDHQVYEHSSVPAAVRRIFDLPSALTHRDEAARPATPNLLDAPRTDTPVTLNRPLSDAVADEDPEEAVPLNDLQRTLLELARDVDPNPPAADFFDVDPNEAQAADYVASVMDRLTS